VLRLVVNLIRGALIGVAEVIPGVSGGTIALIVGIYRTVIDAIADAVLAVRQLVGLSEGRPSFRRAVGTIRRLPWTLLIPVGIGMAVMFVVGASVIEPLLEEHPVQMLALFFGLVLAGIWVPANMVHRLSGWKPGYIVAAAVAALALFFLTGLPPAVIDNPNPIVVMLAAAVAICALVLPGVSGSFLLLSIGLYEPTLQAVNDRDLLYIAAFGLGAIIGLGAFVTLLKWLLAHKAGITLAVLTGLMIGSLRALWPWQTESRELLAPSESVGTALLLIVVGVVVVVVLLLVERRLGLSEEQEDEGLVREDQPAP
jgi:putative membrane protein